jgi:hypothetical protein
MLYTFYTDRILKGVSNIESPIALATLDHGEWVIKEGVSKDDLIYRLGVFQETEYRTARESLYPPIGDQLDALWKSGVFSPDSEAHAMQQKILDIKNQYPKN